MQPVYSIGPSEMSAQVTGWGVIIHSTQEVLRGQSTGRPALHPPPTPPLLCSQLLNNLVHLPGSLVIEPHTAYRMHVVYVGQAIKVWRWGRANGAGWLSIRQ